MTFLFHIYNKKLNENSNTIFSSMFWTIFIWKKSHVHYYMIHFNSSFFASMETVVNFHKKNSKLVEISAVWAYLKTIKLSQNINSRKNLHETNNHNNREKIVFEWTQSCIKKYLNTHKKPTFHLENSISVKNYNSCMVN